MADGTERPSKWIPMTNLIDLAHLGKLGEEAGELVAIISRCIIQGINECDPETGKPNRQALEEEIADVYAMAELACDRFGLNRYKIGRRMERKKNMKRAWHAMLEEPEPTEAEKVQTSKYRHPETYTVKAGDTLFGITEWYIGDGNKWHSLWALNTERIASRSPDNIKAGEVLLIPPGWR